MNHLIYARSSLLACELDDDIAGSISNGAQQCILELNVPLYIAYELGQYFFESFFFVFGFFQI